VLKSSRKSTRTIEYFVARRDIVAIDLSTSAVRPFSDQGPDGLVDSIPPIEHIQLQSLMHVLGLSARKIDREHCRDRRNEQRREDGDVLHPDR
jgi:hypothetical protein